MVFRTTELCNVYISPLIFFAKNLAHASSADTRLYNDLLWRRLEALLLIIDIFLLRVYIFCQFGNRYGEAHFLCESRLLFEDEEESRKRNIYDSVYML